MKKVLILHGSPRKDGNTNALTAPFAEQLLDADCQCRHVYLYDRDIRPCRACRSCQRDWAVFGCPLQDDVQTIFDDVLWCDLLVLSSPIYSWYCTAPMKALLDRLVYGMNKFYGGEKGPALWAGKELAAIATCGYRPEKGADLWVEGLRRYCKHSGLTYCGMLCERHLGYDTAFMDEEKACHAREFARSLL